jgi:hypothetical protein
MVQSRAEFGHLEFRWSALLVQLVGPAQLGLLVQQALRAQRGRESSRTFRLSLFPRKIPMRTS